MTRHSRRSFLRVSTGSAIAALGASQAFAAERPNILFLSVDDMNDWVGCLGGYPGVKTPNIDRLAREGALFTNAHCAAPLCNPSRTALLTGLRPSTSGVYNNEQYWRPTVPNAVTIPEYFRKHGYQAVGAGKIFHHVAGFNPPDQWDQFFMQVFDDPWYRRAEWYPWVKKIPNPEGHPFNGLDNFQGEFDWGVLPGKGDEDYGDAKAVDFATEFLGKKQEKPFFLAVGLWHPHIPMFAPQKYFDMYPREKVRLPELPENDLDDVPKQGQEFAAFRRSEHERIVKEGKWVDGVQAYLASISYADMLVGRMVDALRKSPYGKNTLIVFWSDNGWHLGEKRHWHKSTLWERSTHIPLIIAGPGVRAAGVSRTQPVSLLDLFPTIVDYCALPKKQDNEGVTLVPLLKNPQAHHDPVVSTYEQGNHAVISERWRYIRYKDGTEELYDRQKDPNDIRNLAGQPQYNDVKKDLAKYIPEKNVPGVPERSQYDFNYETYRYKKKTE